MKKTILTALLAVGASIGAFAQGTIAFDNQNNVNISLGATNSGGVINKASGLPETGDFNLQLWGGSSAANLTLIATLLQSDGTAASGTAIGAPGQWIDITGASYVVPGVAATSTGFFQVDAWIGSQADYASAFAAGNVPVGQSAIFQNGTGGGNVLAPDLVNMPSFTVGIAPEPTTFALYGLGAASLLLFRRKK